MSLTYQVGDNPHQYDHPREFRNYDEVDEIIELAADDFYENHDKRLMKRWPVEFTIFKDEVKIGRGVADKFMHPTFSVYDTEIF